jgi:ferric-dicitrate binding protein FerR (iron transport regulator)
MMFEGKAFDTNIIIRFLMNEASESDVQLLHTWIEHDADFKNHFEQIQDTWNRIELEKDLDDVKIQRDLQKVLGKIEGGDGKKFKNLYSINHWLFKAAAVFLIGFGLSWLLFNSQPTTAEQAGTYNSIETPKGSNTIINLPDGSKITLNAESKLRYPQKFSGRKRQVYLEGEAYFEIAKDKKRQFIVMTPEIAVKVYGTSFNVKSYPDDNTVETTLVEGAISLYKTNEAGELIGKEIKMLPKQQLVLYKAARLEAPAENEKVVKENLPNVMKPRLMLSTRIDTDRFTSWKDGALIIKSEPLEKLAITLERRYNVVIHFEEEKIKQFRFTGTIENETIEQVLAAIKLASSVDYRIEEREIWIKTEELN